MALTHDDVRALTAPFPLADHEFTRGFAYITEQAITRRLDQIDPGWQFTIIETMRDQTSASVIGRLIVCGVARDGVGTQSIEYSNTTDEATGEKKVSLDAAGNPREAGEVRKGAATDALKRAARLFGIGRYILDAPKLNMASKKPWETKLDAASERAFADYLRHCGAPVATPPPPAQPPAPAANGWTEDQARSLVTEARQLNVTNDELLALLNVTRISEYAPGFSAARENLKRYVKARPPADPPPKEAVF